MMSLAQCASLAQSAHYQHILNDITYALLAQKRILTILAHKKQNNKMCTCTLLTHFAHL